MTPIKFVNMSKLDSVWETHDFVIQNLTEKEAAYNSLLGNITPAITLYEAGELSKEDLSSMISNARKLTSALKSLYDKHLLTIREVRVLIDDNDVPEERLVTAEVIDELEESTHSLLISMKQSNELFDFIKQEHDLYD